MLTRSRRSPSRCKELPRKDLTRGSTFFHLADFFRSEALMSALSAKLSICRKMPSACSVGSKVSCQDARSQSQWQAHTLEEQAEAAGKEGVQKSGQIKRPCRYVQGRVPILSSLLEAGIRGCRCLTGRPASRHERLACFQRWVSCQAGGLTSLRANMRTPLKTALLEMRRLSCTSRSLSPKWQATRNACGRGRDR